jgi:hypothetical protein
VDDSAITTFIFETSRMLVWGGTKREFMGGSLDTDKHKKKQHKCRPAFYTCLFL